MIVVDKSLEWGKRHKYSALGPGYIQLDADCMIPRSAASFSISESPQVFASSPRICNRLLCEQLTRQQPGNWRPSGANGNPGPPRSLIAFIVKNKTQGESWSAN